jgi:hypothetical protein
LRAVVVYEQNAAGLRAAADREAHNGRQDSTEQFHEVLLTY